MQTNDNFCVRTHSSAPRTSNQTLIARGGKSGEDGLALDSLVGVHQATANDGSLVGHLPAGAPTALHCSRSRLHLSIRGMHLPGRRTLFILVPEDLAFAVVLGGRHAC